jgi:hypothetical protein
MTKKLSHEEASARMNSAGLTPLENYPGRHNKWKVRCDKCNLEISTSLASVSSNGSGCRNCGIKKSAETRKRNASEAIELMISYGALPVATYPGQGKPWDSECLQCGKRINPRLGNVLSGHHPCAFCAKKKVDPDEAAEFMISTGLIPLEKYPGSNNRWKSRCNTCKEIVFVSYSTVKGGGGCLKCGYESSRRKQMVNEAEAVLVMRKAGLEPLVPYPAGNRGWLCQCTKCGLEVRPHYSSIKSGTGCAICAGKQVDPASAAKLMRDANLEPLVNYPGTKNPWLCKCMLCGREVSPKYSDIRNGDGGCKWCGGHYVDAEFAIDLFESLGVTPLVPYINSSTPWLCKCRRCNREISPKYNSVQQGSDPCSYCAKRKVDPEEAFDFMVSQGATPLGPYPGARRGWLSTCHTCSRSISPIYSNVYNLGGNPCAYCAGKKVDPLSAMAYMFEAGLTPQVPFLKADAPWNCICQKCNKNVSPRYTSIRIGQGGCKYCANKGLDYGAPAFLYLIEHKVLKALKVGIGNHKTRNNRIKEHEKQGWQLIEVIDFENGDLAFNAEQEILTWVRNELKIGPFLSAKEMPQRGWTETLSSEQITIEEILDRFTSISINPN